jgi:hypothetical protein
MRSPLSWLKSLLPRSHGVVDLENGIALQIDSGNKLGCLHGLANQQLLSLARKFEGGHAAHPSKRPILEKIHIPWS